LNINTYIFIYIYSTGANAIVVITSAGVVAILHYYGYTSEITTTGYVKPGLPPFKFPSFSVQNGNSTIGGGDIISVRFCTLYIS
jgi:sodium-independent sulfate anion transporter 11